MRWLITRIQEDAEILANRLAELGQESHIFPLMRRVAKEHIPPNWSDYDALAFTSRNGVAMGGPYSAEALRLPVFTVGNATAEAARTSGFVKIFSAQGTGADLSAVLARQAQAANQQKASGESIAQYKVLHLSGETTRTDLSLPTNTPNAVSKLVVDRCVTYTMQPVGAFDEATITALKSGKIDGTICLSPQSAKNFSIAAKKAALTPFRPAFVFATISAPTANELSELGGEIRVAMQPDLENTLALLF